MLFDVTATEHEGCWVLSVTGELDVATAPRLRQEAVRLLARQGARLVLDLSGVDFIDSTGLGVVVGVLKRVRGLGGSLGVVVDTPRVRGVFELTRLDEIVPLHASLAEALEGVAAGG